MNDLMAIAAVRRMLMSLGVDEADFVDAGGVCGPVERWICAPNDRLGGRTPIEALQHPEGQVAVLRVLEWLSRERRDAS